MDRKYMKNLNESVQFFKKYKSTIIQYAGLALVIILFSFMTDGRLLSVINLKMITKQLLILFILCIGLIFVYSHGGFDISVGAVLALCAVTSTFVMNKTGSIVLGFIVSIAISTVLYLINVTIANKFGLMSVISSLAIMFVARGIVELIVYSRSTNIAINIDASFLYENAGLMAGVMIVTAVFGIIIYNYTKFSKQNKAIGDNPVASMQSGVNVEKTKVIAYLIAGVCVGIASIFYVFREGTITKTAGSGFEMNVIIALIMGGMVLNGGSRSKISSAIIGAITFVFLNNGLTMSGVSVDAVSFVKGIIFLAIIFITLRQSKNIKELPR